MGYPDPGHDEWVLVGSEKREIKILQILLGDKKTKLLWYGEQKPRQEEVEKDIIRYTEKFKLESRNKSLNSILNG